MSDLELSIALRKAADWAHDPEQLNVKPIRALLKEGADWELDILPVIADNAHRPKTRNYWNYFTEAIREHWQKRIAPAPVTIYRKDHPMQWVAWQHYFNRNKNMCDAVVMEKRGYYTVPMPWPPGYKQPEMDGTP